MLEPHGMSLGNRQDHGELETPTAIDEETEYIFVDFTELQLLPARNRQILNHFLE